MNENPFQVRKSMTPEEQRAACERLHVGEERMATPEDWQKLRDFRLAAYNSEDRGKIVSSNEELSRIRNRTDQDWMEVFRSGKDRFSVFVPSGSEVVGMGRAELYKGIWGIYNLFVKKEFRGMGIAQKITARCLNEIKTLGGKEIVVYIKEGNTESFGNFESFGFKEIDSAEKLAILSDGSTREWHILGLDLADPAVIQKINEVLGAK